MKSVGIKALKNNLSRYLRYVREGELVYVTDRDEVIAEIHQPSTHLTHRLSRWESFLNAEERKGQLIRASRKQSCVAEEMQHEDPWPSDIDTHSIEDESRSERF